MYSNCCLRIIPKFPSEPKIRFWVFTPKDDLVRGLIWFIVPEGNKGNVLNNVFNVSVAMFLHSRCIG